MNGISIRKHSHASLLLLSSALLMTACGGGGGSDGNGPEPVDTTPDSFTLVSHNDLQPGQWVSLGSIEVAGTDAAASVPISISGGVFAVNNGSQQTNATVTLGDHIDVFAFADAQYQQSVTIELTIGGVKATSVLNTMAAPPSLDVSSLVMFQGRSDSDFGSEPWISDGTVAGTRLLKDYAAYGHGAPSTFARLGEAVFAVGDDGVNGSKLWKIDSNGASFLEGFSRPDTDNPHFRSITVNDGSLYVATQGNSPEGSGLWRSDGTDQAELLIEGYVRDVVALNGVVYASINDNALWRSDGSLAGTAKLHDMNVNAMRAVGTKLFIVERTADKNRSLHWLSADTDELTFVRSFDTSAAANYRFSLYGVGGTLYFKGHDAAVGWEIWRSDGMAGGTDVLAELSPGPDDGVAGAWNPSFASLDGKLFFLVKRSVFGDTELYVSDGTAAGTQLADDLQARGLSPNLTAGIVATGEHVFFVASDHASVSGSVSGSELWRTDGTSAGTALVKDINPGDLSSDIGELTVVGETVYFSAQDGTHGAELWASDGTDAGTRLIEDIKPGSGGARPSQLAAIDNRLYFNADDGIHGREAWSLDGSQEDPTLLADINHTANADTRLFDHVNLGSKLLFAAAASDGLGSSNGASTQLLASDGFAPGTVLVKDINPDGDDRVGDLIAAGDFAFLTADNGTNGTELWGTDGSEQGTQLLIDITPGSGSTTFSRMAHHQGRLYMGVLDRDDWVSELWVTDDTGTASVELHGFGGPITFGNFIAVGDKLFMVIDDRTGSGLQLWATDGTPVGTGVVKQINTIGSSFSGRCGNNYYDAASCGLAEFDNQLHFIARKTDDALGIWKSDGTDAGTVEVLDLQRTSSSGHFNGNLAATSAGLFYFATTAEAGQELWLFDGAANANMVADITPGAEGTVFISMLSFDDLVYLTLRTDACEPLEVPDENGRCTDRFEVWRSDGTENGTLRLFTPPATLSRARQINMFERHNGLLYFRYRDNDDDWSYWRTDGTLTGTIGLSTEVATAL